MISANVIEPNSVYMVNLLKGGGTDTWASGIAYRVASWEYLIPLIPEHVYYVSYTYKYTLENSSATAPTWVCFFWDGGNAGSLTVQAVPTAGVEQEYQEVFTCKTGGVCCQYNITPQRTSSEPLQFTCGSLYHGPNSNDITTNVRGYVKNAVLYDVTEISQFFNLSETALLDKIKSWRNTNYEIWRNKGNEPWYGSGFNALISTTSQVKQTKLFTNLVEADGLECPTYWCPTQHSSHDESNANRYSDNGVVGSAYDYNQVATVKRTLKVDETSPFYPEHQYVMHIEQPGTTTSTQPRTGGFVKQWGNPDRDCVIIEKLVAKIPKGQKVWAAHNLRTVGSTAGYWKLEALSPIEGTGKYEEYTWRYTINLSKCSSVATYFFDHNYSWGGFFYTVNSSGTVGETGVNWDVAYYANYMFATDDPLQYFTVMPDKDVIKDKYVMTRELDERQVYLNGDGSDKTPTLPSRFQWLDINSEYEIHGERAIIQPSLSSADTSDAHSAVTPMLKINPSSKYRLTMRIWAKKSAFADNQYMLTSIAYYTENGVELSCNKVVYLTGTNTQLTQAVSKGDTVLHVSSAKNWVNKTQCGVGFRSNYKMSYSTEDATFNGRDGIISAVDTTNNTITLNKALNTEQAVNIIVVEALSGAKYYYPINKSMLPDGEWKEYSIEFGTGKFWGGARSDGGYGIEIPWDAKYMTLCPNLYQNWSGYPIIYDDIRIEEIGSVAEKQGDCVQIKRFTGRPETLTSVNSVITVKFDTAALQVYLNGEEITQSGGTLSFKSGTSVTITYKDKKGYWYDSSNDIYKSLSGIGITSTNGVTSTTFTVSNFNDTITITALYNQYYKITRRNQTGTTLLLGWSASAVADQDLYYLKNSGGTVYYKFSDSYNYHELKVYSGGSATASYYTVSGSFSTVTSNISLDATAKTVTVAKHTITFSGLDSSKFSLYCNGNLISPSDPKITASENSYVSLRFEGKEYSTSGVYYSYCLKSYSPSTYSSGYFTMPSSDITITVACEAKRMYNITQVEDGCSIYVVARAVPGTSVSYTTVLDSDNNRESVTISWDGNTIDGTNGSSFTMPSSDVTITAKGWYYAEPEPSNPLDVTQVDGLMVYSVANTAGHRRQSQEFRSTIDTSETPWSGAFDELEKYDFSAEALTAKDEMLTTFRDTMTAIGVEEGVPIHNTCLSINSNVVDVLFGLDDTFLEGGSEYTVRIVPCYIDTGSATYNGIVDDNIGDEIYAEISGTLDANSPAVTINADALADKITCEAYLDTSNQNFLLVKFTFTSDFTDLTKCCSRLAILTDKMTDSTYFEKAFFIDLDYCMLDTAQHPDYQSYSFCLPNLGTGLEFNQEVLKCVGSYAGLYSGYPSQWDKNIYYLLNPETEYRIVSFDDTVDLTQVYVKVAVIDAVAYDNGTVNTNPGVMALTLDNGGQDTDGTLTMTDISTACECMSGFLILDSDDEGRNCLKINTSGLQPYYSEYDSVFDVENDNDQNIYLSIVYQGQLYVITSQKPGFANCEYIVDDVNNNTQNRWSYWTTPESQVESLGDKITHQGIEYQGQSLVIQM